MQVMFEKNVCGTQKHVAAPKIMPQFHYPFLKLCCGVLSNTLKALLVLLNFSTSYIRTTEKIETSIFFLT